MDKPTSATPVKINNTTFRCYRWSGLRYIWRSDNQELTAYRYPNSVTYRATVRGVTIKTEGKTDKKFRTLNAAMKAAVEEMEEQQFNGIWPT